MGETTAIILKPLIKSRLSAARFQHCLGVMDLSRELAHIYGVNPEKAALAGLLHDIAREFTADQLLSEAGNLRIPMDPLEAKTPLLLHGVVGAAIAKRDFDVDDPEIIEAISLHITGAPCMSLLAQIVFLSDFAEPNRRFGTARFARELARSNRLAALEYVLNQEIVFVVNQGFLLHPKTVEARNQLLSMGDLAFPDEKQEVNI